MARGDNLLPHRFKPGAEWRGNAKGRPKGSGTSLTTLLRKALDETRIGGVDTPDGRTVAEHLIDMLIGHAMKGNPALLKEILDRIDGKVPAPVVASEGLTVADAMRAVDQAEAAMGGEPTGDDSHEQAI